MPVAASRFTSADTSDARTWRTSLTDAELMGGDASRFTIAHAAPAHNAARQMTPARIILSLSIRSRLGVDNRRRDEPGGEPALGRAKLQIA